MSIFINEWKMQLAGYSRNIRLFLLFNFMWNAGLGTFGLVYNLYVRALGFEHTMVGSLVGMTAVASAIILIPAGILNDRLGPRRVVSYGLLLVLAALTARALLEGREGLMFSAFLGGMAQAVVSATILPFMANNSTPAQRVHLFSLNMALAMIASVLGNLIGGSVSDMLHYLLDLDAVVSLRWTLIIGVGLIALGLVPVLAYSTDGTAAAVSGTPGVHWQRLSGRQRASLKIIVLFAFLSLLSSSAGGMIVPYLNVYFEDRFLISNTLIGLIVSLGQGATALAYLLGPVFARKLGDAKAVVVLQLSSIPFMLVTAYSTNFYLAGIGYLFRQALMNAATPFYNTIKMKYVDPAMRGLASSSGEAMFNLGWFLAAPVSTGLIVKYGAYYGYAYAFSITAVVYTLISVLFYFFFCKDRFRPAEEPANGE